VESTVEMFAGCPKLATIITSGSIDVPEVEQDNEIEDDFSNDPGSTNMFEGCTSLVGGNGTKYRKAHVDDEYARIDGAGGLPGYFTSKDIPAANSAKVAKTKVTKTLKAKKLKKKAQTIKLPKVKTTFGKAKWTVVQKDKKKALKLKGGKVVVKKGTRKGTYTIKLKAKVKATKNWKAASTKTVTVKVKVK